jgi:hypothetical protein
MMALIVAVQNQDVMDISRVYKNVRLYMSNGKVRVEVDKMGIYMILSTTLPGTYKILKGNVTKTA